MTLRLTRLDASVPIVNPDGTPTQQFLRLFNGNQAATERQEARQDETLAGLQETVEALGAEVRRNAISASNTIPTAILTQTDNGTAVTVTMLAHTRFYDDETEAEVDEDSVTVPYETDAGFYYDDPDREGGAIELQFSTDLQVARANYVPGRHALGTLTTIGSGDPDPDPGGGIYPPGGGFDHPIP